MGISNLNHTTILEDCAEKYMNLCISYINFNFIYSMYPCLYIYCFVFQFVFNMFKIVLKKRSKPKVLSVRQNFMHEDKAYGIQTIETC